MTQVLKQGWEKLVKRDVGRVKMREIHDKLQEKQVIIDSPKNALKMKLAWKNLNEG